jgi:putative Mg2+ transporter-C (MgtC) family protein
MGWNSALIVDLMRLGLAVAAGMSIGLEREWHEKSAGFRTMTLVAAGSALFAMGAGAGFTSADRARIAAGVVTGIGFLGAGAILRERGSVTGLTTAAAVWVASALGIAAGFGAYALTVAGTAVALIVLIVFPRLDIAEIARDHRRYALTVPWSTDAGDAIERRFVQAGLHVHPTALTREDGDLVVTFDAFGRPEAHAAAIRQFLDDPAVKRVEVA